MIKNQNEQNPDTQICPLCAGLRVIRGKTFKRGKPCPQCQGYGELAITKEMTYPVKAYKVGR
jgi:DnaJ-class molecular chaperone